MKGLRCFVQPPMVMPVLPPSPHAMTRPGYSIASAPSAQSNMRNPVRPRAAQAAGSRALAMVPAGAVTLMQRNTPSLFGMFSGKMHFTAVKLAAIV